MITNTLLSDNTPTSSTAQIKTIFTSSGDSAVNLMVFCNTDDSLDGLLTVYVVPDGQSYGTKHIIMKNTKLNSLETLTFSTEKLILEDGDSIQARATLADGATTVDITATVSSIVL
jgi:hypothetical protein